MTPGQQGSAAGWWRRLRLGRADDRRRRLAAHALYLSVVEQARRPVFYREWGVPDTAEGRFEVVGLHAFLVLRRLRALGEPGRALAQRLFDLMFADVDGSLRELGVGDLSVGKHVKRYARSFYGRVAALERALAGAPGGDRDGPGGPDAAAAAAVEDVLRRNFYPAGAAPGAAELAAFGAYVLAQDRHLAARPAGGLLDGRVEFAAPGEGATGAAQAARLPGNRLTR